MTAARFANRCIRSALSRGEYESTPHPEPSIARHRSHPACAWGDDGHKTIALIAEQYLEPAARAKIAAMLDADPDSLTSHDLANEATWADKYRDSNNRRDHYEQTQNWHFVDLEIDDPDIKVACFGRPRLPPGTLASNGPAKACIVDKINQFLAELKNPKRFARREAPPRTAGLRSTSQLTSAPKPQPCDLALQLRRAGLR